MERSEVAERIGELRAEQAELADANLQGVIVSLLRIAKVSEALATPAGVKGARLTLIEACRLSADMANLPTRTSLSPNRLENNAVWMTLAVREGSRDHRPAVKSRQMSSQGSQTSSENRRSGVADPTLDNII